MRSYQEFFAELKRRKVFRVAALYGVVSFGVLQAADIMLPRLGVPDWTVTFMVALVVLAFPVALILAWAFEVTPDGVKRTDDAAPGEIEGIMSAPASQRWPAGLMALVGVAALVGGTWWIARTTAPGATVEPAQANLISGMQLVDLSEDTRPSIAVLPFVNMSADEEQEYFSDGMTEEILNTLAKIKELRVAARTSAFAYKGENKDLREIGNELGVRHLIEGSVRKDGDQLRITAQLIDVTDGSHLWTESYTRPAANVFDIQIEIAESIADALKVPLGLDNATDLVTPTADLEAYDLYLAGRSRLRERGQGTLDAIDLFKAAIDRDSAWAPAWAGLAEAMEISLWGGGVEYDSTSFYRTLAEAEEVARQALELQPQNPAALVALGSIHRDRMEWAEAERFYRQALDLDPDNAEAHHQYGEWLAKRGRTAEAVLSMDRATILDPAPIRVAQLINMLRQDTRWDEAEEVLHWALGQGMADRHVLFADSVWPTIMPIVRAAEEGRVEDQLDLAIAAGLLDLPADTVGSGDYVRAMRAHRLDLIPDSVRPNLNLTAYDFIALGEPELAVDDFLVEMEGASPLGIDAPRGVWWVLHDPIRSDPRYQAYMESIGLGGLEVHRTPVDERVRPAILRQADAQRAAASAAEGSAP
jgi:TolB-like protein